MQYQDKTRRHNRKLQHGSVMVEFALTLPILIALVLGTFEIGRVLRRDQAMMTLAHQCAQVGFRTCAGATNPATCMQNLYNDFVPLAALAVPDAEIVMGSYRYKQQPMAVPVCFPGPCPSAPPITLPEPTVTLIAYAGLNSVSGTTPKGNHSKYTPPSPAALQDPVLASNFPVYIMQGTASNPNSLGKSKKEIFTCEIFTEYTSIISSAAGIFSMISSTRHQDALL